MSRPVIHHSRLNAPVVCVSCPDDSPLMVRRSSTSKGKTYVSWRCPTCRRIVSDDKIANTILYGISDPDAPKGGALIGWRFGKHWNDLMSDIDFAVWTATRKMPDHVMKEAAAACVFDGDGTLVNFALEEWMTRHYRRGLGATSLSGTYRTLVKSGMTKGHLRG